jgi:hypothetical protein
MFIIIIPILIIIVFFIYVKQKYGFWVSQPVFHVYDIHYYLSSNKVIRTTLPQTNKWTNFTNIQTVHQLSERQIAQIVNFIQRNYRTNRAFAPLKNNIMPYFDGLNDKSFFSLYIEPCLLLHDDHTVDEEKLVGFMTTRPVRIRLDNIRLDAYYVDYLCVDKNKRNKGIAPQIIQTHEYNQRHANEKIQVSLFKREDELTGIVPLCVYNTHGFPINRMNKQTGLLPMYKLIDINARNYRLLHEFIEKQTKFEVQIMPDASNVLELIKTKNIFIRAIVCNDQLVCAYFFRKTCVYIDDGQEVLSCFASINNDDSVFIHGFYNTQIEGFGYLAMEDLSDNGGLIQTLGHPDMKSPTAYFFYNYVCATRENNKVFII